MKSVGKQLQEARLAKNWTPELAARETKIRVDRLRDLEADNYSHFTSPAYARGFVRTYARSLGLDEYQILRQLDNKLPDDDSPSLVTDSNVGYLPETSLPPRAAHRDYTGLYVVLALGCGILLLTAFVLFQAYRIGELPRYFAGTSSPVESTPAPATNAPTEAARALPVDGTTPPPAVATENEPANAPKALPVDPAAVAAEATNAPAAAPVATPVAVASATGTATPADGDAPAHAVRALPVDPSELTNAPAATVADNTATSATPATGTAPRALPVDLNDPALNAPPAAAPAAPAAQPTTIVIPSSSARQSNSGPVVMPAPAAAPVASAAPAPIASAPGTAVNSTPTPGKRLVLTASQDSFVRVTSQDSPDGDKPLYASVLRSGQSIGFDGRKFSINVGIPSAVDIKLDGVNYGPHSDQETPETFTVESHLP